MDTDPISRAAVMPVYFPFRGKRCEKCGGRLALETHPSTYLDPASADVSCLNCSATHGLWSMGDLEWTIRRQGR